jgi:hypothetical protein
MASILFVGSFLAGSLLSLLIPVGLLIALTIWYVRSIVRVPREPDQTAAHAAGVVEREGLGVIPDRGPTSSNP